MKKIILSLIGILIISSIAVSAAENEQIQKSEQRQLVEMLTYIDFEEKEGEITRAEFCEMIYRIQYNDEPAATSRPFEDVDINSSAAGYIQKLYETGVISGNGTGIFNPDNKITVAEAYTVLLKLAGYNEVIKNGYPDTVLAEAAKNGLSKGISRTAFENVDTETAYIMIYNLFFTDVFSYYPGEDGNYEYGDEFINEVLGIYYDEGIVETVGEYSLYNTGSGVNVAVIGEVSFINDGIISADLLGMAVDYYYKEISAGDYELVAVIPQENRTLKIMYDDIADYGENVYTYYDENDKAKKARIAAGKDVIKNRVQAKDESGMIPSYGYVLLTDNTDDGIYDVVMIYDYTNIFAVYINIQNESIRYSVTTETGTQRKELLLGDKEYIVYNEKGRQIELQDIMANTLLTVMESEKETVIWVNSAVETGQITAMREDKYLTVGENEYEFAAVVFRDGWDGKTFDSVSVYTDIFGNAAVVRKEQSGIWQFGYLMKPIYDTDNDKAKLKVLCADGQIKFLETNDTKLRMDNAPVDITPEFVRLFDEKQKVIRFRMNGNGEIVEIDTVAKPDQNGISADDVKSFDLSYRASAEGDCLIRRSNAQMLYKSYTKMFKKEKAGELDGEAYLDNNTIVFSIPVSEDKKTVDETAEDNDYYVMKSIVNNTLSYAESYNTDAASLVADVVVFYNSTSGKVADDSRTMLVKSVSKAWYDDEIVDVINGFYKGQAVEKRVDTDLASVSGGLKCGDYIRVYLSNDIITDIQLLYTSDGKGELNSNYYTGTSSSYNAQSRYVIGNVEALEGDRMLFKYNDGKNDKNEIFRPDSFTVYVYDKNLDVSECVYIGTAQDVTDSKTDSVNYDTVIVGTRETISGDMFIIKNIK